MFSKLFSKTYFLKIAPLENTFSKLVSQKKYFQSYHLRKIHFQNYSLKKYILKFTHSKLLSENTLTGQIFFIIFIGSRKSLKLSRICLTTFSSIYLHSFKKTFRQFSSLVLIFFESRIQANNCQASLTRLYFRNFLIVKIRNFITMRFHFGFQKISNCFLISARTLSQMTFLHKRLFQEALYVMA